MPPLKLDFNFRKTIVTFQSNQRKTKHNKNQNRQ